MQGERPRQAHLQPFYDAYIEIGRTDVSDVIERAIEGVDTQLRMFPDLYAHVVTCALIEAGIVQK